MTIVKHTPGPWSVKNYFDERHIVIANVDGESFPDGTTSYTYDFVCDTYGDDDSRSMAVAIANARLIAAAPELLKALKWAMKQIGEPRLVRGQNDEHFNAWHAAKDALAKAEGRSDAVRVEGVL